MTIIADQPNNGHLTLLFTDDGVLIQSHCRLEDAYEGLLKAVSMVLLDGINQILGENDSQLLTEALNESSKQKIEKYAHAVAAAHAAFSKSLEETMTTMSLEQQLKKAGLPECLRDDFMKYLNSSDIDKETDDSDG